MQMPIPIHIKLTYFKGKFINKNAYYKGFMVLKDKPGLCSSLRTNQVCFQDYLLYFATNLCSQSYQNDF